MNDGSGGVEGISPRDGQGSAHRASKTNSARLMCDGDRSAAGPSLRVSSHSKTVCVCFVNVKLSQAL
jgi:hypothetical protein